MDRLRRRVRACVLEDGDLETARALYGQWMALLDRLVAPPHQDYANARRGMANCLWLQSPNRVRAREEEEIRRWREREAAAAKGKKSLSKRQ